MKAYRKENGSVILFRPDMNMKRMNASAQRIALPVRAPLFCVQNLTLLTDIRWRGPPEVDQTTHSN